MDPRWDDEMLDPEEDYWYNYYLHRRRMIEEDIAYREWIEHEMAEEEGMRHPYSRTHRDQPPREDLREHPDDTIPPGVGDRVKPRANFPYRDIREDDKVPPRENAKRPREDFPYKDIREYPDDEVPPRVADAKRPRVDFPYRDIREQPDEREERTFAKGGESDQQWKGQHEVQQMAYKNKGWDHEHEQKAFESDGWDPYKLNLFSNVDSMVEEAEIENMSADEKQALLLFKLKRMATIPWCYTGPQFDGRSHEFMVQVFPVSLRDVWKPSFTAITANASSVRLNFGTRKDHRMVKSCLTLMAHAKTVRNLMRYICMHSFVSGDFFVKVEHHKGAELPVNDAGEPVYFPTITNRATFKMKNELIRHFLQKAKKEDKSPEEQLRPLSLQNLPKSVGWQFLQVLFPLAKRGQVVEGDPNSAVVVLDSAEAVAVCVASMSGLHINGQPISMKTDMPKHKALEMLKTVQEATKQEDPSTLQPRQKKMKKLSPSDIRRSIRKKQEYIARVTTRKPPLPEAPPFPGVPSLLSLSFPGPGNTMGQPPAAGAEAKKTAAGETSKMISSKKKQSPSDIRRAQRKKAEYLARLVGAPLPEAPPFPGESRLLNMSFPGPGNTAQYPAADDPEMDFSHIPIPQLLEGPYPEYEKPLPKGTPGSSTKVRTVGYFRRQKARYAVHMYHIWGGNLKKVSEHLLRLNMSLEERPPLVNPPESLLNVTPMTELQLKQLKNKIKDNVSLDEVKKAEEYWLRKRKEKIQKTVSDSSEKHKTPSKILRDKQRMTEFNKEVSKKIQEKSKQSTNATPAKAKTNTFKASAGPSSQSEHWTKQQNPAINTAGSRQQQWKQQYPPAASTFQHQTPPHHHHSQHGGKKSYQHPPSQHSDPKSYQHLPSQHSDPKSYQHPPSQRRDPKSYQHPPNQHSDPKSYQHLPSQHRDPKSYHHPSQQGSNVPYQQTSELMPPPAIPPPVRPKAAATHEAQFSSIPPPPPPSPTEGGKPVQGPFSFPPPPARQPPPAQSPSLSSHSQYSYTGQAAAHNPQFSQPPPTVPPAPFPPASEKAGTDSAPHGTAAQWQQQQTGSSHSWPDTHHQHSQPQPWQAWSGDSQSQAGYSGLMDSDQQYYQYQQQQFQTDSNNQSGDESMSWQQKQYWQ